MFSADSKPLAAVDSLSLPVLGLVDVLRTSGIRAQFSRHCSDDRILAAAGDGLAALAALIDTQPRCRAQLLQLSSAQVRDLRHRDTWVLAPTPQGWLVRGQNRIVTAVVGQPGAKVQRGRQALAALDHATEGSVIAIEAEVGLCALRQVEKASVWARLWALVSLERRELWSLFVYAILIGLLSLAVPAAVQILVNSIAMAQLLQPLVVLSFVLLGVLVLDGTTKLLRSYTAEILARRVFVRVAEDFFNRIPGVERGTRDGFDLSERCQRFFEIITVQKTLETLVVDGLGLVLSTVAGLVLLAFYHPLLLVFDAALIGGFVLVAFVGWGAQSSASDESRAKYRVAAWVRELALHADQFRSGAGRFLARQRGDALISDYTRVRKKHYRRLLRQLFTGVSMYALAMVSLLGLGGYLVMQGELSLGQLVAAEIVLGMVVKGFTKIGKHLEKLYDLNAGLDKLGMVVDLPLRTGVVHDQRPHSLDVQAQSFGAQSIPLMGLQLQRGGRYEFRCADADALLELRAGFLGYKIGDAQQGLRVQARFDDGVPQAVNSSQLAHWSMLLDQERWYELSLLDQLRLAAPTLNQASAMELLDDVGLGTWVRSLPNRVHTHPVEIQWQLTPERQAALLAARVILAQPNVVILGDWLDGTLLSSTNREHLLGLLDEKLPLSIILDFVQVEVEMQSSRIELLTRAAGGIA